MSENLSVRLVTPEGVVFEGEALEGYFPSTSGPLGILRGHTPIIASLKEGEIKLKLPDGRHKKFIGYGGMLDVENNSVMCLLRKVEPIEE